MGKELLIIHANCQGEPLAEFLGRIPAIAERYEIRLVINYVRQPLPEKLLGSCSLFLHHYLAPTWKELSTEHVLSKLPPSARSLCFPSMFLNAYWPFWKPKAAWEYPDHLLDGLLDKGLPSKEIKRIYCHTNVVPAHDLREIVEESLERERLKEQHTPIHHVDEVLARYRQEMLFNTVNHPGHAMLCWLGRRILEELGLPEPEESVEALMPELHPEYRQPVHPLVAEELGLSFAGWETKYPVYGRELTFEEYVVEYLLARANGIDEFITFLRARAEQCEK